MKIVEIEDFVHPSTGYQVNVLSKYFVKFGHDVTIVCGEMDKMPAYLTDFFDISNIKEDDADFKRETGVSIVRVPIYKYVSGRAIYTKKIFEVVDKLKPDILFIHAEDTVIAMQYLLKMHKKEYALIMDNHQCDMSSHNRFREVFRWVYRKIFTPIIKKNGYLVVRLVEDDYYMQDHFGIPMQLTPCITFGTDTLLFNKNENVKQSFRKEYGIGEDAFVFIYAGKLDEYKGGLFLAETLKKKFESEKELVFIVVGNTSGEYGKNVEKTFNESENKILRFPTQKYVELAKFFQASDVCLFAKECSLTFFDAQACGLPVISEDNEINVERCKHNNGINFKKGNIEDFRCKIQYMIDLDEKEIQTMSCASLEYILNNYNYEEKARQFEELMIKEIERQSGKRFVGKEIGSK